jgi:hypothetical protein
LADEPFTISLVAEPTDDCTVRARLQTIGVGTIEVTPDGISARPAAHDAPAEFTWGLVADTPGRAIASVVILAPNSDDVVSSIVRMVTVEPNSRRNKGTLWLRERLDDLVVEATTTDGRAPRAGQPATLLVSVRGPAHEPLPDGLAPQATLETCVEVIGAGVSDHKCWTSTVDIAGPAAHEHLLSVQPEQAGTIEMTAGLGLTGRVDGATTDPVSVWLSAGSVGNAGVTVADRLRTAEQILLRWLAVASGITIVVGGTARLAKWVRNRRRARPRPATPETDREQPRPVHTTAPGPDRTGMPATGEGQ